MPIVRDEANQGDVLDPPYHTPNRTNAGDPNSTLTPEYYGEIVLDTSNNVRWKARGMTNTSWCLMDNQFTAPA